jgi:hypothetical protein
VRQKPLVGRSVMPCPHRLEAALEERPLTEVAAAGQLGAHPQTAAYPLELGGSESAAEQPLAEGMLVLVVEAELQRLETA